MSVILLQYELVCGRAYLSTTASVVYMGGLLTGAFIFGAISDL